VVGVPANHWREVVGGSGTRGERSEIFTGNCKTITEERLLVGEDTNQSAKGGDVFLIGVWLAGVPSREQKAA
jgi:hypothetical protein